MARLTRWFTTGGAAASALVVLAACGSGSGDAGSGGGSPEISITKPSDGANVGGSFEVAWNSSVKLGETDTGRDHVHVFIDGHANDYTVVGGNSFTVKGISPGEHTVNVTLQHADHSSAGAEDEVEVNVGGSGGTSETTPPEDSDTPDPGDGY
jgi:hypothetical protein